MVGNSGWSRMSIDSGTSMGYGGSMGIYSGAGMGNRGSMVNGRGGLVDNSVETIVVISGVLNGTH